MQVHRLMCNREANLRCNPRRKVVGTQSFAVPRSTGLVAAVLWIS
jgi:hypothetical protein